MHVYIAFFKKVKTIVFLLINLFKYLQHLIELMYLSLNKLTSKYGKIVLIFYIHCTNFLYTLSFVCLSTSEAIAESLDSSIDHLFKIKPNTKERLELENTGTVEKLAFIRLNGQPPGIYKSALALTFKGDYASHFLHIGRNVKTTLIVLDRILSSNERITVFFELIF